MSRDEAKMGCIDVRVAVLRCHSLPFRHFFHDDATGTFHRPVYNGTSAAWQPREAASSSSHVRSQLHFVFGGCSLDEIGMY